MKTDVKVGVKVVGYPSDKYGNPINVQKEEKKEDKRWNT